MKEKMDTSNKRKSFQLNIDTVHHEMIKEMCKEKKVTMTRAFVFGALKYLKSYQAPTHQSNLIK